MYRCIWIDTDLWIYLYISIYMYVYFSLRRSVGFQARTEWKLICRKVLLVDTDLRIIETDPIYNVIHPRRTPIKSTVNYRECSLSCRMLSRSLNDSKFKCIMGSSAEWSYSSSGSVNYHQFGIARALSPSKGSGVVSHTQRVNLTPSVSTWE